eukprot:Partr_v1_DN26596_c1_g1_i5_m3788 putative Clusterin associated protein 1
MHVRSIDLLEKLRTLGYPHCENVVTMESFVRPNFPLVAHILDWAVSTVESGYAIPKDIATETQRIEFIRAVVSLLASQAQLKLNPKKLYAADQYAVQELLKLVSYISRARNAVDLDEEEPISFNNDSVSQIAMLKSCKDSAMTLAKRGIPLYDLLETEVEVRDARNTTISKQMDITKLGASIKQQMKLIEAHFQKISENCQNLKVEE